MCRFDFMTVPRNLHDDNIIIAYTRDHARSRVVRLSVNLRASMRMQRNLCGGKGEGGGGVGAWEYGTTATPVLRARIIDLQYTHVRY